jgi:ABC-type xylose transport system permease subunit
MKQIVSRITAPTPSFFKKLRNIGLALVAVATTIVTAPIAMPAIVVTIAGYLAVAGAVLSAVSQTAVESE